MTQPTAKHFAVAVIIGAFLGCFLANPCGTLFVLFASVCAVLVAIAFCSPLIIAVGLATKA